jgi:hypothetical protein
MRQPRRVNRYTSYSTSAAAHFRFLRDRARRYLARDGRPSIPFLRIRATGTALCHTPSRTANGSLLVTPPFPLPGPDEPGSPSSSVLWRRYDFPPARTRPLMVSAPGPRRPSRVRVREGAPDELGGSSSGLEHLFSRRSVPGRLHRGRARDLAGFLATHPKPLPCSKTPAEPARPHR